MQEHAEERDAGNALFRYCLNLRYEELPENVKERTRLAVLDTLAAAMAGAGEDAIWRLSRLASSWGGTPQATLITTGKRLPLPLAGLVNGAAARARDLDDVHEQNTLHLHVNTVMGALAAAQARGGISGASLMTAIAAASEAMCRIANAPRISFSESGSAMSYQLGYYGVALAAAKLMDMDVDRALHAIGIAHSRVAGNHQGYLDGAMTVRVHQGVAVEGGLVAALMAESGMTGSSNVLEGRYGYYDVYHRGRYEPKVILSQLGEHWELLNTSIKPLHPCCKFTHGPIAAMLHAVRELDLQPADVETIEVTVTNKEVYDLVCLSEERKWNPQTAADAQFSLPYVLACAVVKRDMDLECIGPSGLADPRTRALLPRIRVRRDFESQGGSRGSFPMPGIIEVTQRSGRVSNWRVDHVHGHPQRPMSFDDVADKFIRCAGFSRPGWTGAAAVIEAIRDLDTRPDTGDLVALCADFSADDTLNERR